MAERKRSKGAGGATRGRDRGRGRGRRVAPGRSWFWRWVIRLGLAGGAVVLVAGMAVAIYYAAAARKFDLAELGMMPERSEVYDRNGVLIGRLHGENRTSVPLSEVSPQFISALLAREDNRFYDHGGVDYIGVLRALVRNLREGEVVQGASTITMQLARNSYGIFEKSLDRKLTEVFIARRIEAKHSKDEILEAYVNRIYYGSGIYGVERAAQVYFGKPAAALDLGEGAMLAGIIRGPNRFSPLRNYEGAVGERDDVLDRMEKVGRLDEGGAAAAKQLTVEVTGDRRTFEESYALDAVRRDLDAVLDDDDVEDGGFKVFTTLDARLQSVAEVALDRRLRDVEEGAGYPHPTRAAFAEGLAQGKIPPETEPAYLQGALYAIDNPSGGVLAVVGGRDFSESKFNRALHSQRQVGSTFKPFVYTAAFAAGVFPGTWVSDDPIRPGELRTPGAGNWSPGNADGKFLGTQEVRTGLVRSRNTMSVRVGDAAGIDNVLGLARQAGFGDVTSRSPQVFIGNLGATLKTLVSAYSMFPNRGVRRRPFIIERIVDRDGQVVYSSGHVEYPVVPPGLAAMVDDVLEDVLAPGGTGARVRSLGFESKAGGKTGTTNDYHDAWFVGYSDRITCGVWVGLDRPQQIVPRGFGSTLALPVWVDLLKHAEKIGYRQEVPKARAVLAQAELCRQTGLLATGGCARAGAAYTESLSPEFTPVLACGVHRGSPVIAGQGAGGGQGQGGEPRQPPQERGFFDRIRSWFR